MSNNIYKMQEAIVDSLFDEVGFIFEGYQKMYDYLMFNGKVAWARCIKRLVVSTWINRIRDYHRDAYYEKAASAMARYGVMADAEWQG